MKTNYVLFVALSLLILVGWNYTIGKRFSPPPAPAAVPASADVAAAPAAAAAPALPAAPASVKVLIAEFVSGRHKIEFNAHGAGIHQWRIQEGGREVPLVLQDEGGEEPLTTAGLDFKEKRLEDGSISFEASRPDGLRVVKTYKIDPAGHLHDIVFSFENTGKSPVDASFEVGWGSGINSGDGAPRDRAAEQRALALEGPRLWTLKPGEQSGAFRWYGVDARYFLAAFIGEGTYTLRTVKKNKAFSVARLERLSLQPGEKKSFSQKLYAGPKSHDALMSLGMGLERSVNFGMFSSIGRWIHRALISLHRVTNNFGWSIILVTFLVQILVSPLTISGFKHSQKMKAIQPQMKRLQELHKSDPKRLNAEMLSLYQRHGLRFMGLEGCLPMVIQMPVFFALYAVLSTTFELRQAPWIGWIKDLSIHDPYFALPVLMGAAMFGQQKMTMSSVDPSQKQLMYMMPIMFTFIFFKMPSGLVVYWLTNSLLTLALQLFLIKRHAAKQEKVL